MTAPEDFNLGYWCRSAVKAAPDATAIIDLTHDRYRPITYQLLDQQLDSFAAWLSSAGLSPGDRLLIIAANRYEYIILMFGAMRAGIVPVPVNTRVGATTMRYIVNDADAHAAAVDARSFPKMIGEIETLGINCRILLDGEAPGWQKYDDIVADRNMPFEPPLLRSDHPSFMPYTSGTTGRPKGVVLTHPGQLWWIKTRQKYWPYSGSTRTLVNVPLFHKNAMAGAVKPVLAAGGSIVILDQFDPRRFLTVLSEYRCTMAGAVPTVFLRLLCEDDLIRQLDFSCLTLLRVGSAPAPANLLSQIRDAFQCKVTVSYGLTEGGPIMIGPAADGRSTPDGSCGMPWPEGEVKLVDSHGDGSQSQGELWVKNPGILREYFRRPAVTTERLQNGWLRTGDVFRRDHEGWFYFLGRNDDMFTCAGENIYPKEVEDLLLRHSQVLEACVVPLPDPLKGQVPVALVVCRVGTSVTEADLQAFTLHHGAAYAHPRRLAFAETIPVTGAGKVDRAAVRALLESRFLKDLTERRIAGISSACSTGTNGTT